MRITRRPSTNIPGLGDTAPVGDAAPPESRDGGMPVTDRVQLSEAARMRQRLKVEIGAGSETADPEQIAALRAEITNQTYAPSPRAVAERLLGELAADLLA